MTEEEKEIEKIEKRWPPYYPATGFGYGVIDAWDDIHRLLVYWRRMKRDLIVKEKFLDSHAIMLHKANKWIKQVEADLESFESHHIATQDALYEYQEKNKRLEAELTIINASLLARQTNLARDAEVEVMKLESELARLRGESLDAGWKSFDRIG